MESLRGIDEYECQGALNNIIRLATKESFREISTDLIRQYNLSGPLHYIRTVHPEPSGRTEHTYCLNRMVDIKRNHMDSGLPIWDPRRGYVCLATKKESGGILELVPRKQRTGSEFSSLQLVQIAEPLRLPALETYIPGSLEASDLVSRSQRGFSEPATAITGNDDGTRPQKQKIAAHREKELKSNGMEDQLCALQTQGLSDLPINIAVSNERFIKSRSP
ncbi:hypothetical protein AYI68_g356 [Smittium mucronatum]|uniref:Uncharacterized protein n=1 Tax=Smittium mucronatum TaxID=133383 RepID=A0A1R0H8D3_9FUNG|nr:hypothetical protein AYI68_g356 [Smittium mucronatum]